MNASPEALELFQYIGRYRPHAVELNAVLKPFVPGFFPAAGDVETAARAVEATSAYF